MISKIILAVLLVVSNSPKEIYSFSDGKYIPKVLIPFLHWMNIFDSPANIVQAEVKPTNNKRPTVERMKYFNYFSAASYCQYELNDLSCDICNKFKDDVNQHKVIMNNKTVCTAFVTISTKHKEIVVTFRGSANLYNFYLDLFITNVLNIDAGDGIKLHRGFDIATKSLFKPVTKYVRKLRSENEKYKNYKIILTGHSLGGCMARLTLFYWLRKNTFSGAIYEIYTFGELRSGNVKFVDFMDRQSFTSARITHRADIAPHAIPSSFFGFSIFFDIYLHCGNEFWNIGDTGVFCNPKVREDPKCSNSLGPVYSLPDHLVYFNLNYAICYFDQPVQLLAIPHLFQPVGKIPRLPKFIQNILGFFINLVSYPVAYFG